MAMLCIEARDEGKSEGLLVPQSQLPCHLGEGDSRADGDIEGARVRANRNPDATIRRVMHIVGNPGTFAAEQKAVTRPERKFPQVCCALCREQDEPAGSGLLALCVSRPRGVADRGNGRRIVHRGPPDSLVSQGKTTGLDDIQPGAETGRNPHRGTKVLRNIWLKKYDPHSNPRTVGTCPAACGIAPPTGQCVRE